MADIPLSELHSLMLDYVRQRDLQLQCLDITVWEEFKLLAGISKSANWLREEYCSRFFKEEFKCTNLNTEGVIGGLSPKLYDWCNDAREGLQRKGISIRTRLPPIHPSFLESDSLSPQINSGSSTTSSKLQRVKKKITPMERLTRIKKRLVKQKRRLSISSNSSG